MDKRVKTTGVYGAVFGVFLNKNLKINLSQLLEMELKKEILFLLLM